MTHLAAWIKFAVLADECTVLCLLAMLPILQTAWYLPINEQLKLALRLVIHLRKVHRKVCCLLLSKLK